MVVYRLRSLDEFRLHWHACAALFRSRREWERELAAPYATKREPFQVLAYSYPAGTEVKLTVDWQRSVGDIPNWRERACCPITGMNSRLRAAVQLVDLELGLHPADSVYITEQATSFFRVLQTRITGLVGSEYLADHCPPGTKDQRGIRNEDLTRLTFSDGSFQAVLSFECLEHIPDYRAALAECYRVLSPGGKVLLSAPFDPGSHTHLERATLNSDGSITHHLPPEYHGDPLSTQGCLCYRYYGWNLLSELTAIGFADAYVAFTYSREFGYWGNELCYIVARR